MDRVSIRSGNAFGGWWIQPRSHPRAPCGSAFIAWKQLARCSGSGLSSLTSIPGFQLLPGLPLKYNSLFPIECMLYWL